MNKIYFTGKYGAGVLILIFIQSFDFSHYLDLTTGNGRDAQNPFFTAPFAGLNQKLYNGYAHGLAIKADSTVWAWGSNNSGQVGNGSTGDVLYPVQVSSLSGVVDAAGGYYHTLALKSNGTVWAWGSNSYGQLGDGTTYYQRTAPVAVGILTGAVNVAAGYYHSLAIKSDGTLWAWGQNDNGQLGNGTTFNSIAAVKIQTLTNVTDAAGGEGYSIALKSDSTVWAWGLNTTGQLGNGNYTARHVPGQVTGLSKVVAIAAGRTHVLVLKSDGSVWAWGTNGYGQLGNGNTSGQNIPVQVSGLSNVTAIAAGENQSMAIKSDGTLWTWGYNMQGQLGLGTTDGNPHSTPVKAGNLTSWSAVCAGSASLAARSDGSVWAWGNNANGQYGNGNTASANAPRSSLFSFAAVIAPAIALPVLNPDGGSYVAAQSVVVSSATSGAVLHYTTNGADPAETDPVVTSGSVINISKGTSRLKVRAFKSGSAPSDIKAAVYQVGEKLAVGYSHTIGIKSDGSLWTWGNNGYGQVGNGSFGNVWSPFQVKSLTGMVDAAGGYYHTIALKGNGTVWTWGYNGYGQLGDGSTTQRYVPVAVGGLSNIVNVAAGYSHSLAIKSDGTVWAWGQNNYGQLGNGNLFNSSIPLKIPNLTGIIDVQGGQEHSLALKNDGTVWAWGRNNAGQLGTGNYTDQMNPLRVNGLSGVIAIACLNAHNLALKSDGTVWSWGNNSFGQLGSASAQHTPAQVSGLTNVIAIAAGEYHSLAVEADGSVWAWGSNGNGQLGVITDGKPSSTPIPAGNINSCTMVCAGTHSLAVKSSGSVWAWGYNGSGQFGNSSTFDNYNPQLSQFNFDTSSLITLPEVSPEGGAYLNALKVIVSTNQSGATLHYTTNGADPAESDPAIGSGGSINISNGITNLKLRAFKTGMAPSDVKTAIYQVGEKTICGYYHSLAVKSNGDLWAWGRNYNGELGDGSKVLRIAPVKLTTISGVQDAAAGDGYTVALKTDGTVWTWGNNAYGQLGDGTVNPRSTPLAVKRLGNIVNVGAGYNHSLATRSDGTLWAWGQNNYGQVGNGTVFTSVTAVQVPGLSNIIDAAGGGDFSIALKSDGTVWTWGNNSLGQLGDGTTLQQNSPVQVNSMNAVVAIAAGRNHALALKANGTVWAWGYNYEGELGNGNTSPGQPNPTQVKGLSNVAAIAAGERHSLAVQSDGTVWAWGYDGTGQLGIPGLNYTALPVVVPGLTGVSSLSGGSQTLCFTPASGKHLYWAFGSNSYGQLGDSTQTDRNTSVLVHFPVDENGNGIPDWKEVAVDIFTADADRDGLLDGEEITKYGTDPNNFDSNSDWLADGVNIFVGLSANGLDTDGDGIPNIQEILNGTSPVLSDTDGDGVSDKLDAFPLDRFRSKLPVLNPSDHTPPVIILLQLF